MPWICNALFWQCRVEQNKEKRSQIESGEIREKVL